MDADPIPDPDPDLPATDDYTGTERTTAAVLLLLSLTLAFISADILTNGRLASLFGSPA